MTEIGFYHLTRSRLEEALPRLLEKAYAARARVIVRTSGAERLEALSRALWTYRKESFLPHGSRADGEAERQPIYLTTGEENPNGATFLFLTDGAQAGDLASFARCFDLFDGEEMSDLMDFLDEFKSETTVQETSEDFDTHYNLGLAYKEMDMFDEAIEEFQQAFKSIMNDTRHPSYVPCCSMLGYCFTQKGLPRLAIMWLKKGLDTPNLSEDICQSLRYDLADAYAATGDYDNAFETFSEVYAIDVQYRNVKTRLQEVTAQMGK